MRIGFLKINNFKSLVNLRLDLAKFNCLIGLNGAGKSTVLQCIDFLAQMVRGDIKGWLELRRWKPSDLRSRFSSKRIIEFSMELVKPNGTPIGIWSAHFSPTANRCTSEMLAVPDGSLEVSGEEITIAYKTGKTSNGSRTKIAFNYEGSMLSVVKDRLLTPSMLEFKQLINGLESLDMLTPERLRERTRTADGSLGYGGRNLSAFLAELSPEDNLKLVKQLRRAYPQLKKVTSRSLRSGWKQLSATESFGDVLLRTESRHLNDGMLRLTAILAELSSEHGVILFDEIENGINPELIEFVIDNLVKSPKQIVVTTHSPMILNYLDDDAARQGVIYLYKTRNGHTQAIPFFSIPSLAEKLTVMGPGEAFVDTNLTELSAEIATMAEVQ